MRMEQDLTTPSPSHSSESFWSPSDLTCIKPDLFKIESGFDNFDAILTPTDEEMRLSPFINSAESSMPDFNDIIDTVAVSQMYDFVGSKTAADVELTAANKIASVNTSNIITSGNNCDEIVTVKKPVRDTDDSAFVNNFEFCPIEAEEELVEVTGNNVRYSYDNEDIETDNASKCSSKDDLEDRLHEEYKSNGHKSVYLSKLRSHRLRQNRSSSSETETDEKNKPAMVARLPPRGFVGTGSESSAYTVGQFESLPSSSGQTGLRQMGTRNSTFRCANSAKTQAGHSSNKQQSIVQSENRKTVHPKSCSRRAVFSLDSSKSAVQARINREKKKAYISGLENHVAKLMQENEEMSQQLAESQKSAASLSEEVEYLRAVLANQSALSTLIGSINGVRLGGVVKGETGCNLQVEVGNKSGRKRVADDHDYTQSSHKKSRFGGGEVGSTGVSRGGAGVCVHVRGDELSVQLCRHCAKLGNQ